MNKENGKILMQLSKETLVYEVLVTNDRLEAMEAMLDKAKEAIKGWEPVRHGHWMYKYRVRDGIQYHTGEDIWGNTYTIQCDERYEINDPYCSECHRLNDGSSLDWCPNCGAKMDEEAEYARVKTLPLSVRAKMDGGETE